MRLSKQTDGNWLLEVRVRKVVAEEEVSETIDALKSDIPADLQTLAEIYNADWCSERDFTEISVTDQKVTVSQKASQEKVAEKVD